MSKKVKFTISGDSLSACDQFAVVRLKDPKKSNSLLFRISRPAVIPDPKPEPDPGINIWIETSFSSAGSIDMDNCYCYFVDEDIVNRDRATLRKMLGLEGSDDISIECYRLPNIGGVNMGQFNIKETYISDYTDLDPGTTSGIKLIEANFFAIIELPDKTWRISDQLLGRTFNEGDIVWVTKSFTP